MKHDKKMKRFKKINDTPLVIASKIFSYQSTDSMIAQKWSNRFLFNAMIHNLEISSAVDARFRVSDFFSLLEDDLSNNMQNEVIAQKITHLHFIKIENSFLRTIIFFQNMAKKFSKLRKVYFEGFDTEGFNFETNTDSFVEQLLLVAEECPDLKHFEFIGSFRIENNEVKKIKNILQMSKEIQTITFRSFDGLKTYERGSN